MTCPIGQCVSPLAGDKQSCPSPLFVLGVFITAYILAFSMGTVEETLIFHTIPLSALKWSKGIYKVLHWFVARLYHVALALILK